MANSLHLELAFKLARLFSALPQVEAAALAGSQVSGSMDHISDIDLYVYTTELIPLTDRQALLTASGGASRADMDLQFWDLGDEWFDAGTGIEVDVMYWDTAWITEQLDRVLVRHQAAMGYTTSFWHTIQNSKEIYDRHGWFGGLKEKAAQPYPEELRREIIRKNQPVLRSVIPSYLHQIEKAIQRGDLVSLNHRVAALLASYFDVLFALNRLPNPGEKRLLRIAAERCTRLPAGMREQVEDVLRASVSLEGDLTGKINRLVDNLDRLLVEEGLLQGG
jgi:hypothetical protein